MLEKALSELLDRATNALAGRVEAAGGDADVVQVPLYDLVIAQAEFKALKAVVAYTELPCSAQERGVKRLVLGCLKRDTQASILMRLRSHAEAFGLSLEELAAWEMRWIAQAASASRGAPEKSADKHMREFDLSDEKITQTLGQWFVDGAEAPRHLNEETSLMRETFRQFSEEVVKPLAERVHREDLMIPNEIIQGMKELGCFGLSVPERFGGLQPDDGQGGLGMVVVTEELSRGSLGAAGSLITRPEIVTRSLLAGGTLAQQKKWLPAIAAGHPLCAVSVTEPNAGSDVAAVRLKANRVEGGWLLNGGKTWCTFGGKAQLVLVLARTDPAAAPPHRGLSLFLVEKPATDEHQFEYVQKNGGRISGRSIPTIGYRGMHSFEMFYDDYFVPQENLVGETGGEGKGFYYTMEGFSGGRIQTAARACGVMQAAFDAALVYARERIAFGKTIAEYPLTLDKLARMGVCITACRQFYYAVAKEEDQVGASLVKLYACKMAEWVCREAMQIHGGMGYAEESSVSRYYVDARVLSIFEGAEETLALKVVGKALLERSKSIAVRDTS